MRTQLLGLAAAAVAAGTLSLTTAPAHAIGGVDSGNISWDGTLPSQVDVVGTTPGDAVAAWVRPTPGGVRIQASVGTDGAWALPAEVAPAPLTGAIDLQVVGNDKGDVAVIWTQVVNGKDRVRGARYLGGNQWDGAQVLTDAAVTDVLTSDATIDAAGTIRVAEGVKVDASNEVHVATWAKGQAPVHDHVAQQSTDPVIATAPSGRTLLAYKGAGSPTKGFVRVHGDGSWTAADDLPWPDDVNYLDAGISDQGRGTVAFLGDDGPISRVVTSDVGLDGHPGGADIVSPAGQNAAKYGFEVAPDGRASASWSNFVDGHYALRFATRPANGDFAGFSTVEANQPEQNPSLPFARSNGTQVVVHGAGGELTFRHRSNALFTFGTYEGGPSDGPFAADTDSEGNVVAVSIVDDGASSYVQGDWIDATAPVAQVTGPGAQVLSRDFDVTWSAVEALAGTKSTDVIVRAVAWNKTAFTTPKVVGDNLVSGPHHVTGASLGATYCFEAQAIDKANNLGQRSALRCTAVPLDDRALKGSGWSRVSPAGNFNGTLTATTVKGRKLTRTGIQARRLALVVAKAPNGGKVKVTWNGSSLGTFSLKGTAAKKKVITLATFSKVRSGTLRITVVSPSGRKVMVDGLVVSK